MTSLRRTGRMNQLEQYFEYKKGISKGRKTGSGKVGLFSPKTPKLELSPSCYLYCTVMCVCALLR